MLESKGLVGDQQQRAGTAAKGSLTEKVMRNAGREQIIMYVQNDTRGREDKEE